MKHRKPTTTSMTTDHARHPVRVLLRRARRHAWDDAINEAFERGLLHEEALIELTERNPWKDA